MTVSLPSSGRGEVPRTQGVWCHPMMSVALMPLGVTAHCWQHRGAVRPLPPCSLTFRPTQPAAWSYDDAMAFVKQGPHSVAYDPMELTRGSSDCCWLQQQRAKCWHAHGAAGFHSCSLHKATLQRCAVVGTGQYFRPGICSWAEGSALHYHSVVASFIM